MLECWEIKQGMIFFVDDVSSEESTLFKGEHTPKKRRPWLVVSNDKNNMFSEMVSMVPIYTRTEARTPTQVYFKYKDRHQVICCENVTCIPKTMIDTRGYVGTVGPELMKKVTNALHIQFSTTILEEEVGITDIIEEKLQSINIENIIANKLLEVLFANMAVNATAAQSITPTTTSTPTTNTQTEEPVSVTTEIKEEPSIQTEEPVVLTTNKTTSKRRRYGHRMTLSECMEFYIDAQKMTMTSLYEKWKDYGVRKNKTDISKKRSSIKRRLVKEGLLP